MPNAETTKTNRGEYWNSKFFKSFKHVCIYDERSIEEILTMDYIELAKLTGVHHETVFRHGGAKCLIRWKNITIDNIKKDFERRSMYSVVGRKIRAVFSYAKKDPEVFLYIDKRDDLKFLREILELMKDEIPPNKYHLFCLNIMLYIHQAIEEKGVESLTNWDFILKVTKYIKKLNENSMEQ